MEKSNIQWMIEPLRKYATFSGRARRAEYWWFYLFTILAGVAASLLDSAFGLGSSGAGGSAASALSNGPINSLLSLGLLLPTLAVAVRRLHDVNRSGWWLMLPFGALLAIAVFIGIFAAGAVGLRTGGEGPGAAAIVAIVIAGIGVLATFILLLVWFCTRGTDGPNRFGPDPLHPEADDLAEVFS